MATDQTARELMGSDSLMPLVVKSIACSIPSRYNVALEPKLSGQMRLRKEACSFDFGSSWRHRWDCRRNRNWNGDRVFDFEADRKEMNVEQADPPNSAIAPRFQIERHRRGVGDPGRWTNELA